MSSYEPVESANIVPELRGYRTGATYLVGMTSKNGQITMRHGHVVGVVYSSEMQQQVLCLRLTPADGDEKGKMARIAVSAIIRDQARREFVGDLLLSDEPVTEKQLEYLRTLIQRAWRGAWENRHGTGEVAPSDPPPRFNPNHEHMVRYLLRMGVLEVTGEINDEALAARDKESASYLIEFLTGESPI